MSQGPRCLNVSRISALLLRSCFLYATVFGVITFRIERKKEDSQLVARDRKGYRWFCVITRLLASFFYGYSYEAWAGQYATEWYLRAFFVLRLSGCLICSVIILVMQVWFAEDILGLINTHLELFRRLKSLSKGERNSGFGGNHELVLLSFKAISLLFVFLAFRVDLSSWILLTIACDFYTSISTGMIMHFCFIGYLSVGILYKDLNNYVDGQLRVQLGSVSGDQPSREAVNNLDKCLVLYEDIHQVARRFQRLFDLPLFLTLAQSLSAMAMVSYHAILRRQYSFSLWGLVIKLLIDVVLLTMSVHAAISGSRLVKRLSLENFYVTESKSYHMKMDLFLGRLNHQELRVRPLGLFEVSNELTLFFLSAMVTYLTFLVQYGMQSRPV
ncbi:putative gustatory receptor 93b [Drosophila serrata]|uniref:putative gustatory receptor 93b n=1 Tax=Drosophila serrata TaxID=7274 RepID=UPI000A1D24FD|nr:putative gustatory receptor 93b [Drosophila serrata]